MKRAVLALLLMFGLSAELSSMNTNDVQQTVIQQKQEKEKDNTALWIAIITGCITPIAIAFINRKKK